MKPAPQIFALEIDANDIRSLGIAAYETILGPPNKRSGGESWWRAPYRQDRNPSLRVTQDGLWYDDPLHIGGDIFELYARIHNLDTKTDFIPIKTALAKALNISAKPVESGPMPEPTFHPELGHPAHKHIYSDRFRVWRWEARNTRVPAPGYSTIDPDDPDSYREIRTAKEIRPLSFNGKRWLWVRPNGLAPLYRLSPAPDAPIIIVEGELKAEILSHTLPDHEIITWNGGCNGIPQTDWSPIANRSVFLWPDNDGPGLEAMARLQRFLLLIQCEVKIIPPYGDPGSGDDCRDLILSLPPPHNPTTAVLNYIYNDQTQPPVLPEVPEETVEAFAPYTDAGMAIRLARFAAGTIVYVTTQTSGVGWFSWNGQTWDPDPDHIQSGRIVSQMIVNLHGEAAQHLTTKDRHSYSAAIKAAEKYCSASKWAAVLTCARSVVGMSAPIEQFDSNPLTLNTTNGILNLESFELSSHSPGAYLSRQTNAPWIPNAQCPRWIKFLHDSLNHDQAVIDWFQLFCGYLITGTVNQKMAVFLAGPKDCGKTTFLEAFGDMMGTYAGTATPNLILEPKGSRIIEDEANCHGRRLVAVSEAPPEVPLDIGRFKRLTGGDTLVGERKFQSQFSFAPTHKIVYACNDFPRVNVLDPAVWSRVRVVPFSVPKAIDRTLRGTLQTEAPGILVWAANGLRRLQNGEDLTLVPEAMKTAANDWRDKSDWIYDWHDEHCIRNPSAETKASDAIKSLRAYRTRKASPIGASDKAILAAIQALGYSKILHPKHRVTYFRGLEVR